jgi:hypothetical protein
MLPNPTRIFKLFLFLLLLAPAPTIQAQDSTGTNTEQTVDKKKKSKKNEIDTPENNEGFFMFQIEKLSFVFFMRLLIDLVSIFILIRLVYYPNYNKKDFFFTFFMFNVVMFMITYLLNKVELSTGAAFGLFAVFSLLRYRTEDISAKDMTYLFVVIALGLVTAVNKGNIYEICIINAMVIMVAYLLDGNLLLRQEMMKNVQYDDIEMIKPENHAALIVDLKKRTGLNIHKVSIGRIDYLRDTANVKIYYYEDKKSGIVNISDTNSGPSSSND